jgi:glycine cleavage system H protein
MATPTRSDEPGCCIWMEAGLVAYKLCDHGYDCEACPFDAVMRGSSAPVIDGEQPPASGGAPAGAGSALKSLSRPEFPADRSYHSTHTWVQTGELKRLRIGLDALVARLADRMTGVVLPLLGQRIEEGKVGAWLIDEAGPLAIHMPANGHVLELNAALKRRPRLAIEDPYGAGWLIEVECPGAGAIAGLFSAKEMGRRADAVLALFRERVSALGRHLAIRASRPASGVGPTLLDGGPPHHGLRTALGPAAYQALVQSVLTGRPPDWPSRAR